MMMMMMMMMTMMGMNPPKIVACGAPYIDAAMSCHDLLCAGYGYYGIPYTELRTEPYMT